MAAVMASPALSVRAGAGLRLLRASVFTVVCVVLAAAGHSLAAGRTVPLPSLALGWVAVFAVVAPLAGRERSLPGIAAVLGVGQITLHSIFNIGRLSAVLAGPGTAADVSRDVSAGIPGSPAGGGGLTGLVARLLCGSHGPAPAPAATGMPVGIRMGTGLPGARPSGDGSTPHGVMSAMPVCSLPMFLGHLLAAVVAGWLLRRGESALWRLVGLSVRGAVAYRPAAVFRRAHALLSVLAAGAPYAWLRTRCSTGLAVGRHRTVWLRHCVARRGPPVVVLAA
jgi:hypothetical protein